MGGDPRRRVPRTDAVLADPRMVTAAARLGHVPVKAAVVAALQAVRDGQLDAAEAVEDAVRRLPTSAASPLRVINATGVVLHTNLGRAPLSPAALEAIGTSAGYVDVEFDLATGERARRGRGALDALRAAVPDAQDVLVVNNGAAALVLATTALTHRPACPDRDVIVSRGEMVEIGDGFRLPDLIESTGARLREVGTTNRVTIEDYRRAADESTAAILKVHPSNFRIEGFTRSVDVVELATVGPPVIADVGSGLLRPNPLLPDEPDVTSAVRAGAAVVTCSGDKLLGGPQAGLLFGTAEVIGQLRRHPLARALRVDKLTLAALEATLRGPVTPTWTALTANREQLRTRCECLAARLAAAKIDVDVLASSGAVGGGGAPGVTLPGWAVALAPVLATPLRLGRPPVVGRVEHRRLLLDLRCVHPDDDEAIAAAVIAVRDSG